MLKHLLLGSLFSLLFFCVQGQIVLSGKILKQGSGAPMAYANIGILNSEIGTISNADGTFTIQIPPKHQSDELLVSSLGFETQSFSISQRNPEAEWIIYLKEKSLELQTVTISSKRGKKQTARLGNGKSFLLSGTLYFDTVSAGSAVALRIDKQEDSLLNYVQKVSLYIARNKMPTFKVRLRFLEVDKDNQGKPGEDILEKQLIAISQIRKGWLDFELPPDFWLEQQSFYLMFEWILDKDDRTYIAEAYDAYMTTYPDRVHYDTVIIDDEEISIAQIGTVIAGTLFGTTSVGKDPNQHITYYRINSFGEWKRAAGPLSARIKMGNYPASETDDVRPCEGDSLTCEIERWVNSFQENQQIPGFQLAISKDGEMIHSQGYGMRDLAQNLPVTTSTQFRIASISKSMTAIGLVKLLQEKDVSPHTSIQSIIPSFPQKNYSPTIQQVAGHLGGIRGYAEKSLDEIFIQEHYPDATSTLPLFQNDTLIHPPGTQFFYSSYGYMLIGAVIEVLSGRTYLDYMQEAVWGPLEMGATYGDVKDSLFSQKSRFYDVYGNEGTSYDLSYSYSTGGLLSTSEDLVTLGNAILGDSFLDSKAKELLFQTQYNTKGIPTGYGMGWYTRIDIQERPIWYHAGELPSSGSMLIIYPEENIVIALLANAPILSYSEDGFSEEFQRLGNLIDTLYALD
ncbi:MAG: serine hydrolase [Bacteroidota bacterium]